MCGFSVRAVCYVYVNVSVRERTSTFWDEKGPCDNPKPKIRLWARWVLLIKADKTY